MNNQKSKKRIFIALGIMLAVLIVAVTAVFVLGGQSGKGKAGKLLDLGEKYLDELDYEQALACFNEALEIDPKNEQIYLKLAETYIAMGEPEKAVKVLEDGLEQTESEELRQALEKAEAAVLFAPHMEDGIYHTGYYFYDLTEEELSFLQRLVEVAKQHQVEETFRLIKSEQFVELLRHHDEFVTWDDGTESGSVYIAFERYKIYMRYDEQYDNRKVSIIPLDEEEGYQFETIQSEMNVNGTDMISENRSWLISDCNEGMFNGNYVRYESAQTEDKSVDRETKITGSVKNGLLDGAVIICEKWGESVSYKREDYVLGKGQPVQIEEREDGGIRIGLRYRVDENGNAILNEDGSYMVYSTHDRNSMEDFESQRMAVDRVFYTTVEQDGILYCYSW